MHASCVPACGLTLVAWRLGALPRTELWSRYVSLGGNRSLGELTDYLGGTSAWPPGEHNILAQALNERLWELQCASLVPHRTPVATRPAVAPEAGHEADPSV
jgi:hypothetical protein